MKIMKKPATMPKYFNIITATHIVIMLLISFLIYSTQDLPQYAEWHQIIDRLLIDDIGLYSKSRPFTSKVLANYVAFFAPITTIILYLKGFDNSGRDSSPWIGVIINLGILIPVCYVNYFSKIILNTEDSINRLTRGDAFIGYFIMEFGMLIFFYSSLAPLLTRLKNIIRSKIQ